MKRRNQSYLNYLLIFFLSRCENEEALFYIRFVSILLRHRLKNPLDVLPGIFFHGFDLYIRTACRTNLVATSRAKYARCGGRTMKKERWT